MIKKLSVVLVLVILTGCIPDKIHINSEATPEHKFDKSDKICLILPDEPSDYEIRYVKHLQNALTNEKFTLVDRTIDADLLMAFEISEKLVLQTFHTTSDVTIVEGQIKEGDPKLVSQSESDPQTVLKCILINPKDKKVLWQATLGTPDKYFQQYPVHTARILLRKFGKNEYQKTFYPKPRPK